MGPIRRGAGRGDEGALRAVERREACPRLWHAPGRFAAGRDRRLAASYDTALPPGWLSTTSVLSDGRDRGSDMMTTGHSTREARIAARVNSAGGMLAKT